MARRKRNFIDDDDPDSSDGSAEDEQGGLSDEERDPDFQVGREIQGSYGRKKRKVGGKNSTTYGSFAGEEEEEPRKRTDWTRAPAFVSGEKLDLDKTVEMDDDSEQNMEEDGQSDDGDSSSDADEDVAPSPRVREEEEDEPPKTGLGGIGMGGKSMFQQFASAGSASSLPTTPQTLNAKAGIGAGRRGIGMPSEPAPTETVAGEEMPSDMPSSFGAKPSFSEPRQRRAFVKDEPEMVRPVVPLSAKDRAAFSSYKGSVGERLMAKMGYQMGQGLGAKGEGIVTPVETKLRPKNAGIAFKGFEEKTEQAKQEAKRKAKREGKDVSDDEDDLSWAKGKDGKPQKKRSDAWRKPAKRKIKVEHKTYEQILQEADGATAVIPEKIIDATGAELREVSSVADVSIASWTPTSDLTRIPELRHNAVLICETCKTELDGLAREAKGVEERKVQVNQEDARLRKKINDEATLIARLQAVHLVVDDIDKIAREAAGAAAAVPSLDAFTDAFEKLVMQYSPEFEKYRLDEIVVAAMAPTVKVILQDWQPLEHPDTSALTPVLRRWRTALKMSAPKKDPSNQLDVYGAHDDRFLPLKASAVPDVPMTPYESLMWNVWIPRVRSVLNNEWNADIPTPVVRLFESWSDLLPDFIRDNFLDQLIMPKIIAAISNWSPKTSDVSLQSIVFPWLPHMGLRMEEVMDDARRKVKNLFRSWKASEGLPTELLAWKEVFNRSQWEEMLLKYVVPKLSLMMREDFQVNPAQQDMDSFKSMLEWHGIIRSSVFTQILETEFFPKWLDVLHQWLTQTKANFDEVADWYTFWKRQFPPDVILMPGIQTGLMFAQQLMNDAATLSPSARKNLRKPDYRTMLKRGPPTPNKQQSPTKNKTKPSRMEEITFKSIVEERVANHNLLFMPAGRSHAASRMPLYRVSKGVDGRGGIDVFIMEDAVWLVEGDDDYKAISLDDLILRATKR